MIFGIAIILGGLATMWIEARYGLHRIRHDLRAQGWELTNSRWRPRFFSRQVAYNIDVQRGTDGRRGHGTAFVGGGFWSPFMSRRLDYEWDGDDLGGSRPTP